MPIGIWDIIILTTGDQTWRDALQEECSNLSIGQLLPPNRQVIVIDDPSLQTLLTPSGGSGDENTMNTGVGSGGATINAILVAAETLSAMKGRSMINSEDLKSSRVLLVHMGRPSSNHWLLHPSTGPLVHATRQCSFYINSDNETSIPSSPLSSATSSDNTHNSINTNAVTPCFTNSNYSRPLDRAVPISIREELPWPATPLLSALWNATALATSFTSGVWVSSVDCGLSFAEDHNITSVPHSLCHTQDAVYCDTDVILFTVDVPVAEAINHGPVLINAKCQVEQILYRPSKRQCESARSTDGNVPIISGQVYLSPGMCERLLALHTVPPFTHCTYHATDAGLQPIAVRST